MPSGTTGCHQHATSTIPCPWSVLVPCKAESSLRRYCTAACTLLPTEHVQQSPFLELLHVLVLCISYPNLGHQSEATD